MSAFLSSIQLPIEGRFLRKLTKREWEILLLLAESFPDTEAADKSYITLKSYHNYKNRLCRKLGFKRAADLADFATKRKDQIELWAQWLCRIDPILSDWIHSNSLTLTEVSRQRLLRKIN